MQHFQHFSCGGFDPASLEVKVLTQKSHLCSLLHDSQVMTLKSTVHLWYFYLVKILKNIYLFITLEKSSTEYANISKPLHLHNCYPLVLYVIKYYLQQGHSAL